jgi:hypothetical protein
MLFSPCSCSSNMRTDEEREGAELQREVLDVAEWDSRDGGQPPGAGSQYATRPLAISREPLLLTSPKNASKAMLTSR